jgi:L-amino acid N-acyltransferase YncA
MENGYSIRPILWQDYVDACTRLEGEIFGDYFAFYWAGIRSEGHNLQAEWFKKIDEAQFKVILGIFYQDDLVGWHYSVQRSEGEILMKDTGILAAHQNKGIYSMLLSKLLVYFESLGFSKVFSYHRSTNNQVIIPKLRAGFFINGLTIDSYGLALELIYAFDPEYRACLKVRSGEIHPRGRTAQLMGLE